MASQHNLNTLLGGKKLIDKRQSTTSATSPITIATYTAAQSESTLDTALATFDAAYWTTARLEQTCHSDKVHALRMSTDSAGIS